MRCRFGLPGYARAKLKALPAIVITVLAINLTWSLFLCADETVKELARLGQQPITEADVDFQLGRRRKTPSGEVAKLPPLSKANLQATIYLIAQQRQALQTLRSKKLASSREDVETWVNEHAQPGDGTKLKVPDIVRSQASQSEITESAYRDHIAFRLSWQRYLINQLTEKNVAKHFENDRKRFDGTKFRITSLAIPVPAGESARRTTLAESMLKMQADLKDDKAKWDEIAKSIDPAAVSRVDYWVRGTGDLDPSVVTTLIKLPAGDVSEPIHTPTSVQLVRLLEVEFGDKQLTEVRDEVRAHMLIYLLEHLASQSRDQLPLKAIIE